MKLNQDTLIKIGLVFALVAFVVMSRLLPHPANFAPVAAVAIFGGAILPRKWAIFLPLIAIVVSDLFIGLHTLIPLTWGSFVIVALLSSRYIKNISPVSVVTGSIGASAIFFLITNFGVWVEGRLYALTLDGLISCYYNALPFFRNTLLGDLFYSTVLFGAYDLVFKINSYSKYIFFTK